MISDKCDNCLQLGKPVFGRFNFRPSSGYTTEGISCIQMYHQWSTSINNCEDMISHPAPKQQLFSKGSLIPLMGWQDTSTVACSACLPGLHATDWGWGWTACFPDFHPWELWTGLKPPTDGRLIWRFPIWIFPALGWIFVRSSHSTSFWLSLGPWELPGYLGLLIVRSTLSGLSNVCG